MDHRIRQWLVVLALLVVVGLSLALALRPGHPWGGDFGLYIRHVSSINVLFGSLSSVCIILLWTYYSSIALLYSVEYMYVLHRGPFRRWERDPKRVYQFMH